MLFVARPRGDLVKRGTTLADDEKGAPWEVLRRAGTKGAVTAGTWTRSKMDMKLDRKLEGREIVIAPSPQLSMGT
jgi:hypothetical protein